MSCTTPEVRRVLENLVPLIIQCKENLRGAACGQPLYGLQSMSNPTPALLAVVTHLLPQFVAMHKPKEFSQAITGSNGMQHLGMDTLVKIIADTAAASDFTDGSVPVDDVRSLVRAMYMAGLDEYIPIHWRKWVGSIELPPGSKIEHAIQKELRHLFDCRADIPLHFNHVVDGVELDIFILGDQNINIELDGPHHTFTHLKMRQDAARDLYLRNKHSITVVRIPLKQFAFNAHAIADHISRSLLSLQQD